MKQHRLACVFLKNKKYVLTEAQAQERLAYHIAAHFLHYSEADAWEKSIDSALYWDIFFQIHEKIPVLDVLSIAELRNYEFSKKEISILLEASNLYRQAIEYQIVKGVKEKRLLIFPSKITKKNQLWILSSDLVICRFIENPAKKEEYHLMTSFKIGKNTLPEALLSSKKRVSIEADGPIFYLDKKAWRY